MRVQRSPVGPVSVGVCTSLGVAYSPQQKSCPPRRPQVLSIPVETAVQSASPPMRLGLDEAEVVSSPSWPRELSPQHQSSPAPRKAHACVEPTLTRVQPPSLPTRTGTWL